MSACDKAKAILNIDQGCKISQNLAALGASIPVGSETLESAATDVHSALALGPEALTGVHAQTMAAVTAAASIQHTVLALTNLPGSTANTLIRGAVEDLNNAAMGVIGVVNTLNCIARTLDGSAIPGMQKAAACIASGISKLNKLTNDVQSTVNKWQKVVNDSVTAKLQDIDAEIQKTVTGYNSDSSVVMCLSSMTGISDVDFTNINAQYQNSTVELGDLGKQTSGCAALARDTAAKLKQAQAALSSAQDLKNAAQTRVQNQITSLTGSPVAAAAMSLLPQGDLIPGYDDAVAAIQDSIAAMGTSMLAAAQKSDLVSVAFTYGHDVRLDRVGNVIKITHKDGHYSVWTADSIIHAADVTHKHLLWLENAILKFNSHTHLYNPGPGGLTPTRTPIPVFDMSDGTTITQAG
jgi:hypothetical protein